MPVTPVTGLPPASLAVPLNLTSRGRADPAGVFWAGAPTQSAMVTAIAIIIVKPTASLFGRFMRYIYIAIFVSEQPFLPSANYDGTMPYLQAAYSCGRTAGRRN